MYSDSAFLRASVVCLASFAIFISGCAMTETGRDTAVGAGAGAIAGGIVGNGRGAVVGAGLGALGGYAWSQYMAQKRDQMARASAGTGVQVMQTQDNRLELYVPTDISFAVNSAEIDPRLRPILNQFAYDLTGQRGIEINIVGHTDSSGGDAINDPLSLERANSVRHYLVRLGVDGAWIRTEGRGSHQPLVSNATPDGRARNRRVEIFLGQRMG